MRLTAFWLGALLAAASALAQAPAPLEELALPPRYEVEILVFAHRDFDPTEERFDPAPSGFGDDFAPALREAPVFDESQFALPDGTAPPADASPPSTGLPPGADLPPVGPVAPIDPAALRAEALRVRPLAPEELELGTEYRRLRAIAAYEPLLHAGWVQPGLPEADSVPFELKTLGVLNVSGTVRVHLSRFLHITLDLKYHAAAGNASMPPAASDGLAELVFAPEYRLKATRSARSGELHYFDHPAFGVLVRVTPVQEQDASGRPAA